MDTLKYKVVEEAEIFLRVIEESISSVEKNLKEAEEDKKQFFRDLLDDIRIKYSQALTNVVLYKAKHGIFTLPRITK
jgi:hypothetical protein